MNMSNKYKKELEKLYKDEDNSRCFDCGKINKNNIKWNNLDKTPAHWASINNGVYLCLDCSGEHRSFGVQVSYIKSLTLDQWNETQFNTMRVGGNKRLRDFLLSNDMPEYLDKKEIYSSKLMSYYRRMLKVEAKGEMFMEQMPPREHFWDPAETGSENENESYSGGGLFIKIIHILVQVVIKDQV